MSISSLSNFSVPINGSDNTGLLMPKLKYRFKVTFDGLGIETDTTELTKQVSKASRPSVKFENKVIDVYNSKINYAGKPTWDAITISIRDDAGGTVNRIIGQQNQKQFDFFEQSSAAAAGDYKFRMTIFVLDGANNNNYTEANILETWECYGCYIVSSTFGELVYSDASAMEISLSIQPDNCIQTSGGAIGDQNTQRPAPSTQPQIMGGGPLG
jgi:hypothetical protein